MGWLSNLFGSHKDHENIMEQAAEQSKPKIRFSKVYKFWVCDFVPEQLKDTITPGNSYRLHRGELPEEYFFFDDRGQRNDSGYMAFLGHYVKENEDGSQEIIIPPEAKGAAFANGIITRIEELIKLWKVIDDDLADGEDENDGFTREDIEEMNKEIAEGKFRLWDKIKAESDNND